MPPRSAVRPRGRDSSSVSSQGPKIGPHAERQAQHVRRSLRLIFGRQGQAIDHVNVLRTLQTVQKLYYTRVVSADRSFELYLRELAARNILLMEIFAGKL